ncbi:hypothetical protein BGZ50_000215, partial [Haplosporangium sp. Z 11]
MGLDPERQHSSTIQRSKQTIAQDKENIPENAPQKRDEVYDQNIGLRPKRPTEPRVHAAISASNQTGSTGPIVRASKTLSDHSKTQSSGSTSTTNRLRDISNLRATTTLRGGITARQLRPQLGTSKDEDAVKLVQPRSGTATATSRLQPTGLLRRTESATPTSIQRAAATRSATITRASGATVATGPRRVIERMARRTVSVDTGRKQVTIAQELKPTVGPADKSPLPDHNAQDLHHSHTKNVSASQSISQALQPKKSKHLQVTNQEKTELTVASVDNTSRKRERSGTDDEELGPTKAPPSTRRSTVAHVNQVPALSSTASTDRRLMQKTEEPRKWLDGRSAKLSRILEKEEADNIDLVPEYSTDIFAHMRYMEMLLAPAIGYRGSMPDNFWNTRLRAIDLICRVHSRISPAGEILFLAVNIFDRAISREFSLIPNGYVLAMTCLLIATKYEERIRFLRVDDFLQIIYSQGVKNVDNASFRKGERDLLAFIKFDLGWPGPLSFLRRGSRADGSEDKARTIAKYLLEMALYHPDFLLYKPSLQAASALYIGRVVCGRYAW